MTDIPPRATPPSGKMPTTFPARAFSIAVRIDFTGTPLRSTEKPPPASSSRETRRYLWNSTRDIQSI